MKKFHRLLLAIFGSLLFLSLNFVLPTSKLHSHPTSQRVVAATPTANRLNPEDIQKSPLFLHHKLFDRDKIPSISQYNKANPKPPYQIAATILQENGSLTNGDDVLPQDGSFYDTYTFQGKAGQEITIILESASFDTYVLLLDSNDNKIGENDDFSDSNSNSRLTITLPRDDTYTIIVNSYDASGRGSYTLSVGDNSPSNEPIGQKPTSKPSSEPLESAYGEECFQTLIEADLLYLQGQRTEAEPLYRQCKPAFSQESSSYFPEAFSDPEQLSPQGSAYWRLVQDALDDENILYSKLSVPLAGLVESDPGFIPGHMANIDYGYNTYDALERATSLFPHNEELAIAYIEILEVSKLWLYASIAARQFAIVNPDRPDTAEFIERADENFRRFRNKLNGDIISSGIVATLGGFLTGDFTSGVVNAASMARMMIEGESSMGSRLSASTKEQGAIIDDPEILEYVDTIGQDVAKLMGRDGFEYEFNVIVDDSINAFAYPGGKVFVNTGAIFAARSEAELAGLLGHEVAHAVLSHGFQRLTKNNLLGNLGASIPFGNFFSTLVGLDYSRGQERQSDILGNRALASQGYAADGLRNFFVILQEETGGSSGPEYLSTHPTTENRIRYLEAIIQRSGYNRYAYEGVEKHAKIQQRLREIL